MRSGFKYLLLSMIAPIVLVFTTSAYPQIYMDSTMRSPHSSDSGMSHSIESGLAHDFWKPKGLRDLEGLQAALERRLHRARILLEIRRIQSRWRARFYRIAMKLERARHWHHTRHEKLQLRV